MKQLLAGIPAMLFLLFSCNDSNSPATAKSTSDSSSMATNATDKGPTQAEKNTENMKAVYKGIETGDMSAMNGFVAEDIVDHNGPHGEVKGRDSVEHMLADLHNHFTDLKIELISSATDGDYNFALSRFTGKTKDGSMGAPANTSVDDTSVDLVKIVNGKVVEHWSFEKPRNMAAMNKKHKMGKM